jgi:hypothetical protein
VRSEQLPGDLGEPVRGGPVEGLALHADPPAVHERAESLGRRHVDTEEDGLDYLRHGTPEPLIVSIAAAVAGSCSPEKLLDVVAGPYNT